MNNNYSFTLTLGENTEIKGNVVANSMDNADDKLYRARLAVEQILDSYDIELDATLNAELDDYMFAFSVGGYDKDLTEQINRIWNSEKQNKMRRVLKHLAKFYWGEVTDHYLSLDFNTPYDEAVKIVGEDSIFDILVNSVCDDNDRHLIVDLCEE